MQNRADLQPRGRGGVREQLEGMASRTTPRRLDTAEEIADAAPVRGKSRGSRLHGRSPAGLHNPEIANQANLDVVINSATGLHR